MAYPRYFLSRIYSILNRLDELLPQIFRQGGNPPSALALAGMMPNSYGGTTSIPSDNVFGLRDIIGDGLLWAVPKHRRTVEKRLNRKFGYPKYNWKPLTIKTHLRLCNQCGHDYEVGVLCPHCYAKVREETNQMQEKIQNQLGLEPVEQEVIVLYEGEKAAHTNKWLNNRRVVEIQKPRPMWFSKNLVQKTTEEPADTNEVKPSDLA